MKKLFVLGLFMFSTLWSMGQNLDSLAAITNLDSLLKLSDNLFKKQKFEEVFQNLDAAQKQALESFGEWSAAYGKCCYYYGKHYSALREYSEAEKWYLKSVAVIEKISGKENRDYANTIIGLGTVIGNMGRFEEAERLHLEGRAILERMVGKENQDYAFSSLNQGVLYLTNAIYDKAEPLLIEGVTILEKVVGKESPVYINALTNLASMYRLMGKYREAEIDFQFILAYKEKTTGKENIEYSMVLNNLSTLYHEMSDFDRAEKTYLEVVAIRKKLLGIEHTFCTSVLNNLAILYTDMGNFEKAEQIFDQIIPIQEKTLGKEHPDLAVSVNNLANLYTSKGLYEKSESAYLKVLAIREKTLGKDHPKYISTLESLGNVYWKIGIFEKAEPILLEALASVEKRYGKEHTEYATTLENLAIMHQEQGLYSKAEPFLIQSLSIKERIFGKDNHEYAKTLHNLANLHILIGDYEKSSALFSEAQPIMENALGKEHPDYATFLFNVGEMYRHLGKINVAKKIFIESQTIREKTIGIHHPSFIRNLLKLVEISIAEKEYENLDSLITTLATLSRYQISQGIKYLSERELQQFLRQYFQIENLIPSVSTFNRHNETSEVCYDNCLFYKGFLLNTNNFLKLQISSDSDASEKYNQLTSLNRRIANLYSNPLAERPNLPQLEARADSLEKILVRSVAGFAEARKQVNWQEVQKNLSPGEAAVEFVRFDYFNPEATDSVLYAALVLRPGDEAPHFVYLFEKQEIAPHLQNASGGNYLKINNLYASQQAANGQKTLGDLIWNPLDPYLKDVKTVYCSPAGLLHRLNLGAIRVADGSAFSDRHKLILLGSTRQLVSNFSPGKISSNDAYLAGGIRYAMDSLEISKANLSRSRGLAEAGELEFQADSTLRGDKWGFLPESSREVLEINQLLKKTGFKVQADTGFLATEEAFRSLGTDKPSPKIVHLSTHGFFFPEPKTGNRQPLTPDRQPIFKMSEHPMIRTGLVMAGGNATWSGQKPPQGMEDGILTAYEISQMNLSNTELVVLSACETGLGDIEGNEGVYGLQRAFKIAGAKYLIMSLWKVNDQTTRELMTEFYRQWLDNQQSIPDAFRAAQARLRAKYPDAPFHWAGFVLVE